VGQTGAIHRQNKFCVPIHVFAGSSGLMRVVREHWTARLVLANQMHWHNLSDSQLFLRGFYGDCRVSARKRPVYAGFRMDCGKLIP